MVSSGTDAAAYIYNDGAYLYYRLRLDATPASTGGSDVLKQFGWGFELDTNQNLDDYEWLILIDGIDNPERILLRKNSVQGVLGDPSDAADDPPLIELSLPGNYRILLANTTINGNADYFLDFRIPYASFKTVTGLSDDSLIRYFAGSSRSTNNITDSGADLVGGSDLYSMASDYVSPTGILSPSRIFYDGTIRFVDTLDGVNDVVVAAPGDTLYLNVRDLDLTPTSNPSGTLPVTLTTSGGDSETVVLSVTGVTGKYAGSIATAGAAVAAGDGVLQIADGDQVTVTYLEAVAANRNQNVTRTDLLAVSPASADTQVTKSVDKPVAAVGEVVTFTVRFTNFGPNSINGLVIDDPLPAGLAFLSATTTNGTYSAGTGLWTGFVEPIARFQSETLTLRATVLPSASGTAQVNTATGTFNGNDPNPGNNTASATVYVGGTDLRVTKDLVTSPYPAEGGVVIFHLRVSNLGPNPATGVVVNDLLPTGLTYFSDSGGGSYDPGSGNWSVGALAAGVTTELFLRATVDAGTTGTSITNVASLAAVDQPDSNPANNSDTALVSVGFVDLALTKVASTNQPDPLDDVTFTLTLTNTGPNDATGIVVEDLLPAGVTYQSDTPSLGSYDELTGLWSVGDLPGGATAVLTIVVNVDLASAGTTIVNEAEITALDQPDPDTGNNLATATLSVDGTDLEVTKTVDDATPIEGQTVTFTVTITNNGPNIASNIALIDVLPKGLKYPGGNAPKFAPAGTNFNTGSGLWQVPLLAVGATATLELFAVVQAGTSGTTITNVATLTFADQPDPNEDNNFDSALIAVEGTDLALTKSVDDPIPPLGGTVTFTLTVTNNGPAPATGLVVNDLLPPELTYAGDTGGGAYDAATGDWTVGSLAVGASATLDIEATVNPATTAQVIRNTATIDAVDQSDPDDTNDTAFVDLFIGATNIAIGKSVDDATPDEGATVTFTVTASNAGSNPATGVFVADLLPSGLTLSSTTPSQGGYGAGVWYVGTLAAGSSATLLLEATVDTGTAGATITNTAELSALDQIDTDGSDNVASASVTPQLPTPEPVLTVLKSASGPTAKPGEAVGYSVIVLNSGTAVGQNVILEDKLGAYIALELDPYNNGTPFSFTPNTSGLAIDTIAFASDPDESDGIDYSYTPVSGGGGAPPGFDALVTHWRITFTNPMAVGGQFSLAYRVRVQ